MAARTGLLRFIRNTDGDIQYAQELPDIVQTVALSDDLALVTDQLDATYALTHGRSAAGDGAGGLWYFDATDSTTVANGATVLGAATGRWKRVINDGVLNARWFGAKGDGSTNDLAALKRAAAALSTTNNKLYLPAGTYAFSTFDVPITGTNNCSIFGDGPATILKRTDALGKEFINLTGLSRCSVYNMTFQLASFVNFQNIIVADDATDLTIHHCIFEHLDSAHITTGAQLPCVLARRGVGFSFHHNRVLYCQLKAGGSTGDRKVNVSDNYFYRPYNGAVSVVGTVPIGSNISDVIIARNVVEDPRSEFCFFVGGDGEANTPVTLKRILIDGNVVYGTTSTAQGTGVLMDLANTSEDITITNNIFRLTDNGNTPANSTSGILIKSSDTVGTPTFRRLTITNNKVYGVDKSGVEVQAAGQGLLIAHNMCEGSRGIVVRAHAGSLRDVMVAHNVMVSSIVQGVKIWAAEGNITDFKCVNNIVSDVTGAGVFDAGINVFCEDGRTLSGIVEGNRCTDTLGVMEFGIREFWTNGTDGLTSTGTGTFAVQYINNDCAGAAVRGYNLTATAVGRGNRGTGFVTKASGIVAVGNAATSVAITHGLSHHNQADSEIMVPSTVKIISMRLARPTNGDTEILATVPVDDISNTTVTARLSAATGSANYKLHWEASLAEHLD